MKENYGYLQLYYVYYYIMLYLYYYMVYNLRTLLILSKIINPHLYAYIVMLNVLLRVVFGDG